MKHREKRVLMVRDGKFHKWPEATVERREWQGWVKVSHNSPDYKRYQTPDDETTTGTTTKTSEKGA